VMATLVRALFVRSLLRAPALAGACRGQSCLSASTLATRRVVQSKARLWQSVGRAAEGKCLLASERRLLHRC